MAKQRSEPEGLPPDNGARIVLIDAMAEAANDDGGIPETDLFEQVIPRFRLLFPRELHILGEEEYVKAKISASVEAGLLSWHTDVPGYLVPGGVAPRIRYPDGTIRDYSVGLEQARERLEDDEARLRRGAFQVRSVVSSPADDKTSERYQGLVASMQEHGFLEFCPIVESASGDILDGFARIEAAADAGVSIEERNRVRLKRRNSLLQQVLLVLHLNAARLTKAEVTEVQEIISARVGRPWIDIQDDLEKTQAWRRAKPRDYDAKLDVKLVPYRDKAEPKIQVTTDGTRVHLASLLREAGMPAWARDYLRPYVAFEEARTQLSNKSFFVRISDAIEGIGRMQRERGSQGLKLEPAWEEVGRWLHGLHEDGSALGVVSSANGQAAG